MCVCVYVVVHWHCSVQLSMFNMEKRYRNKIIIIIIKTSRSIVTDQQLGSIQFVENRGSIVYLTASLIFYSVLFECE